ncbi:MAG: hypothetical protein IPG69_04870 [Flavobacteriales bacterium]|nr:hypothetical protein [Flavobacteriales bacterium]
MLYGVGCWDVTVTVAGTTYPVFVDLFCVHPFPVAGFSVSDTTICEGGCVQFTDTSTPAGQIDQWFWTNLASACPDSADLAVPTFTCCIANYGTYYPELTVVDVNGCPSDMVNGPAITVSEDYPTAAFNPVTLLDCPVPMDIVLNSSSTGGGGGSITVNSWTLVDLGTWNTVSTGSTSGMTCTGLPAGDYEACLTVENAAGCSADVCHPVTLFTEPDLAITVSPSPTCAGVPVTFSALGTTPASPGLVKWDIDCNGVDGIGMNWSHAFQLAGIYNVCVHIEYTTTCFKDTMFIVEVLAPLVAAFTSGDTTVCFSPLPLSFLNESSGLGVLSYSWLVNSVQQATTTDFNWTFNATSTVELAVSNTMGCTASAAALITIDLPDLSLSNIPFGVCAGIVSNRSST